MDTERFRMIQLYRGKSLLQTICLERQLFPISDSISVELHLVWQTWPSIYISVERGIWYLVEENRMLYLYIFVSTNKQNIENKHQIIKCKRWKSEKKIFIIKVQPISESRHYFFAYASWQFFICDFILTDHRNCENRKKLTWFKWYRMRLIYE